MKPLDRLMRLGLRAVERSPRLRSLVQGRLRAAREQRLRFDDLPELGSFTDREGQRFTLLRGLRDRLRPRWRLMLRGDPPAVTDEQLLARATEARASVRRFAELARIHGASLEGRRVVEIGCYDGLRTHALREAGAAEVTGTDIADYYRRQAADGVEDDPAARLADLRERGRRALGLEADGRVRFVEDDIARSHLGAGAADALVSWEVLEHLGDPAGALRQMARVLAPGGVAIHEYNPFPSLQGGHSLGCLDFLWGHARIDGEDFDDYVRTWRLEELGPATRFFHENLNRMTLAQLGAHAGGAGLETLAALPIVEPGHVALVTEEILTQVRRLHPTATLLDLVAPTVIVVHRRPDATGG